MNQAAVPRKEWPRARSVNGVMVESMDRPQGDHVDRTAAAVATIAPLTTITTTEVVALMTLVTNLSRNR